MKRFLSITCFSFCIVSNAFSQSAFFRDLKTDIITGSFALGLGMSSFFVENNQEHFPSAINLDDINMFDRFFIFSYNRPLDLFSDYGVFALAVLPLIPLMPNLSDRSVVLTYGIMGAEALLLTLGSIYLLKNMVIRYRPSVYTGGIPGGKEVDYYKSFPSGAASLAFLGASFLAVTYSREFPVSRWKAPVILGGYALAAGFSSLRVMSGSHFVTDVLMGAAIGSLYGWVIPLLHIRKGIMAIIPTGNGVMISVSR